MPNTKDDLVAALALIENVEHWTYGDHAQTRDGTSVYPTESNAYCFCADGALAKVCQVNISEDGEWRDTARYDACAALVRESAHRLFGTFSHIAVNDGEDGTIPDNVDGAEVYAMMHENIMRVFVDAIEHA